MPVPFLDLKAQYKSIKREVDPAIQQVIDSCAFALGPAVEAFEKEFAAYCGTKHCVALASGTAALEFLIRAYDIGPGDDVITVTNSFFASAEAISLAGANPILVDCRAEDALIDISKIEAAITPTTRAIIPVHLYGQCADMDAIFDVAKKRKLIIIEDACQAHGSTYKGKKAGSFAFSAAFSFYPGKNLGAFGEAGAITTNDDHVAATVRMLRDHGMPKKYYHQLVGRNDRMDGIQGAVLSVKLRHLDVWNAARKKNADLYRKHLEGMKGVTLFKTHDDRGHNYHLFVVRVQNRDTVIEKLKTKGIATGIHYPVPIHLQPAYGDRNWKPGDFPVAEQLTNEILSLPMFPELTEAQIEEVCRALAEAVKG